MGQPGMGEPGAGKGGLRGGTPFERGIRQMGRSIRPAITVSAITSPMITVVTDDGWSRDVDTTGVSITRNGATITLDDVHVGDAVRLGQTRNEDGAWTINSISVQLALVQGTVASVDTDSFTITDADGAPVVVRVSDTTRWVARRGTAAGLSSLTVGSTVVVEGVRAADGSIDAMAVGVRGIQPSVPGSPVTPTPSSSPVATQG
jgi:hypothetical protein